MSSTTSDDTPPAGVDVDSAHSAGAGREAAEDTARPPPRKRRRIVISCTECHRRKQKCDRKLPCTNCVSRNKQGACRYDTGAPTARQQQQQQQDGTGKQQSVPGRDSETSASPPVHHHHHVASSTSTNMNRTTPSVPTLGYTSSSSSNTLTFLSRIDAAHADSEPLSTALAPPSAHASGSDVATAAVASQRYKSLIRQLPARNYIDALSAVYFREFNWQYYTLDQATFERQLAAWYRVPFDVLSPVVKSDRSDAADGMPRICLLPEEMRAFPGLVFQVLAVALLVADENDKCLSGLKYAGGMTFADLAVEYSDVGMEVLALLGKRCMGLTTIQAGWVRAGFLKYIGMVTESWHAIGATIRDAQEIGLHRDRLDPKPVGDTAEAVLECQWEVQRRRRVWMSLAQWDAHMACVLGRPTTIDYHMTPPSLPVDAPDPKDCSRTPVLPRGENDPPTPLTKALWAHRLMGVMHEIIQLEKEGPCPKDFGRVDKIHNELFEIVEQLPACFRLENPDTQWDHLAECHWLPLTRLIIPQLYTFEYMALHRPYIFTRPKSRTEALKASLDMLHVQRLYFQALKPQMYRSFSLFYGSFDAIVLMASIYILFPKEHPDLVHRALQHFQWAVERFEAMSATNALAKAALGVLHAMYLRLKKSLGISGSNIRAALASWSSAAGSPPAGGNDGNGNSPFPTQSLAAVTDTGGSFTTTGTGSRTTGNATSGFSNPLDHQQAQHHRDSNYSATGSTSACSATGTTPSDFFSSESPHTTTTTLTTTTSPNNNDNNNGEGTGTAEQGQGIEALDWNSVVPSDFDWTSLQPIHAMSDLLYNDLVTVGGSSSSGWGGGGQHQQQGHSLDNMAGEGGGFFGSHHQVENLAANGLGTGTGGDERGSGSGLQFGGFGLAQGPCQFQFEGCFGDDSVWSLLNQYAPL